MRRFILLAFLSLSAGSFRPESTRTIVSIHGDDFFINGRPTYEGRYWKGYKVEGLLINSRMVQGIFDDLNPETRERFIYPDTKKWDPDRNTREFIDAMDDWHRYGLNSFTINLQGGSPVGYGNQKSWINSAYNEDGGLRPDYMGRLEKILRKADELHMVVIVGLFYFGQDQNLRDEEAIKKAATNAINWLFEKDFRNVLVEVDNECNITHYDHPILKAARVDELITMIKAMNREGFRYFVSTSFGGNTVPSPGVVKSADFLLIHGNGVESYEQMQSLIDNTRKVEGYRTMPVVVNEDDHFDFNKDKNNFVAAVERHVSWAILIFEKMVRIFRWATRLFRSTGE